MSGEGNFSVNIAKNTGGREGTRVSLRFQVAQHIRDVELMKSLVEYLGCGRFYLKSKGDVGDYVVSNLSDIETNIIPFFVKYKITGKKALDFSDFCEALKLIKDKEHLTELGVERIRLIKAGMNRGRKS